MATLTMSNRSREILPIKEWYSGRGCIFYSQRDNDLKIEPVGKEFTMEARRSYFARGISLTALASLLVGVIALGIVFFLLSHLANNMDPGILAVGASAVSQDLLIIVATWPGIGFLLALAGTIAGLNAIPEKSMDDRSQACKWVCRLGISLSLAAIFGDMLIISYLRVLAEVLGTV
jgi:hypothetical protein